MHNSAWNSGLTASVSAGRLRQHRRQQQEFHRHLRFERPARRHEQQRGRPDLRVESRRYRGIVPGAGEEDKLIILPRFPRHRAVSPVSAGGKEQQKKMIQRSLIGEV